MRRRDYPTNADRQRAYRQRKKEAKHQKALDAQGVALDAAKGKTDFVADIMKVGEDAIEAFFRPHDRP